jgi:YcxB-like protein
MEVEFQMNRADYFEFYKIYFKNLFQKRIPLVSFLLFFFITGVCNGHFSWLNCALATIGYVVLVAVGTYFIPLLIARIRINRLLSKEKAYTEKTRFVVTEEGLRSETENLSFLRKWESIKSADSNKKFIYIRLIDKKILIIPKRYFHSDVETINFLGLIKSYNKKINWNYKTNMVPARKPPL